MKCDIEEPKTDGYVPVVLKVNGECMPAVKIEGMNSLTEDGSETEKYAEDCGGIEIAPQIEPEVKSIFKPHKPKKPLPKELKKIIIDD